MLLADLAVQTMLVGSASAEEDLPFLILDDFFDLGTPVATSNATDEAATCGGDSSIMHSSGIFTPKSYNSCMADRNRSFSSMVSTFTFTFSYCIGWKRFLLFVTWLGNDYDNVSAITPSLENLESCKIISGI